MAAICIIFNKKDSEHSLAKITPFLEASNVKIFLCRGRSRVRIMINFEFSHSCEVDQHADVHVWHEYRTKLKQKKKPGFHLSVYQMFSHYIGG